MATVKQRRALAKMVENGGVASTAMIAAGYSKRTAVTPSKLTDSDGFKELCAEYGLTDDFLVKALVSDIKKKPKNRKPELELAFKIRGRLKEDFDGNKTVNILNIFNDEITTKVAKRIVGKLSTRRQSSKETPD